MRKMNVDCAVCTVQWKVGRQPAAPRGEQMADEMGCDVMGAPHLIERSLCEEKVAVAYFTLTVLYCTVH